MKPLRERVSKYHRGIHPKCRMCKLEEDVRECVEQLKKKMRGKVPLKDLEEMDKLIDEWVGV